MNILTKILFPNSVKKFNTHCKETLHFPPVTEPVKVTFRKLKSPTNNTSNAEG